MLGARAGNGFTAILDPAGNGGTLATTMTPADAADLVRPTDVVGIPLGPGQPGAFLHALGQRESFTDLKVTGALLTDLFELFGRPGVRYLSGFFGPLERLMRDQGQAIDFVPADFR